ncbi:hypothetical protein BJV74DRAFT_398780 [Russula compacta]|nr:hypothetical protein BJV74DRAFT_398780 [Russula compacta]
MASESINITQYLSARTPGSSILPDGLLESSASGEGSTHDKDARGEVRVRDQVTINVLPDDALFEIFHSYGGVMFYKRWWWKGLVHVCRRWRHIIFASPHGLGLELFCTEKTPTRTLLDIWPPFPILISCLFCELGKEDQDNVIAALEYHDRVSAIFLAIVKHSILERLAAVMLFPAEFSGGYAPRLRSLTLWAVAFPEFPKLALSATQLSNLCLWNIPDAGYISPEAMATCLATLPNLISLSIGFGSSRSHLDQISLPPRTRAVLPVLTSFRFSGSSAYSEDFVSRIDTPQLYYLDTSLFMEHIFDLFDTPRLLSFITRAERLQSLNRAELTFSPWNAKIALGLPIRLKLTVDVSGSWRSTLMARLCKAISPLLSHVELLEIYGDSRLQAVGEPVDANEPPLLVEILRRFTAVQSLYTNSGAGPLVIPALHELARERATEVLPALRSLFFKGSPGSTSVREAIESFIAARQHSNHLIDVHWEE